MDWLQSLDRFLKVLWRLWTNATYIVHYDFLNVLSDFEVIC